MCHKHNIISYSSETVTNHKTKNIVKISRQSKKIKNRKVNHIQSNYVKKSPNSYEIQNQLLQNSIQNPNCAKIACLMLKDLLFKCGYKMDTYLASLQILRQVYIPENHQSLMLKVATIVSLIAKTLQFRTPKFPNLILWGNSSFNSYNLIQAESELLMLINFKIPLMNNYKKISQMISATEVLQFQIINKIQN